MHSQSFSRQRTTELFLRQGFYVIQFAWPICHRPSGDYQGVAGRLALGRPFRQPLQLPDAANYSDGLELWVHDAPATIPLYACYLGRLEYRAATNGQPPTLRISPILKQWSDLGKLPVIEATPVAFLYKNVDHSQVRDRLITLLTSVYASATGAKNTWHPAMRDFHFRPLPAQAPHPSLKAVLDDTPAGDRPKIIAQVVDHVLNNSAKCPNARLPVMAGDIVGEPGSAMPGTSPPSPWVYAATSRQFIFAVEERGGQLRNPLYDLWEWIHNSKSARPLVSFLAPDTSVPHPIISLSGLQLTRSKPMARMETVAPLRPIPISNLNDFHGRGESPIKSRLEWRLSNDGMLETRIVQGQPSVAPSLRPEPRWRNLVERMWGRYGADIVEMSTRFQVPAELIMAFLGKETLDLTERVVRFEPADDAKRRVTDGAVLGDRTYARLAEIYQTVTPINGFSAVVPDPWSPMTVIRTMNSTQLTWGDMAELLNLSTYFQSRLSPGLMQTLISTARETITWLDKVWRDIAHVDIQLATRDSRWPILLGVATPPANPGTFFKDWLLRPRNSILVGTAYIRRRYNDDREGTFWDPPRVAAAYNAGSVMNPQKPDEYLKLWHMHYYHDYMPRFGAVYNAAVEYLNSTPPGPIPSVRLRR